jgi:hypothetical protein
MKNLVYSRYRDGYYEDFRNLLIQNLVFELDLKGIDNNFLILVPKKYKDSLIINILLLILFEDSTCNKPNEFGVYLSNYDIFSFLVSFLFDEYDIFSSTNCSTNQDASDSFFTKIDERIEKKIPDEDFFVDILQSVVDIFVESIRDDQEDLVSVSYTSKFIKKYYKFIEDAFIKSGILNQEDVILINNVGQ